MRFKDFLLESDHQIDAATHSHVLLQPIYKKIGEECAIFLSRMGKTPVYRSSEKDHNYIEASVRKDRSPLTSSYETHHLFDRWIEKETSIKGRSQVLFVSTNRDAADGYGNKLYYVFPKGEFTCIGFTINEKPVRDTIRLSTIINQRDIKLGDDVIEKLSDLEQIDMVFEKEKIKVHKFKKIPAGFNGEIAIYCEEYFMVQIPWIFKRDASKVQIYYEEILEKIKEN